MKTIQDKAHAADAIEIVLLELENDGYYSPDLKRLFINKRLDEAQQQEAINAIKELERIGK